MYINKWTHHCMEKHGHEERLQSTDMTYHTSDHTIWQLLCMLCVSVDWNAYYSSELKIYVSKQIQLLNKATIRNVSSLSAWKFLQLTHSSRCGCLHVICSDYHTWHCSDSNMLRENIKCPSLRTHFEHVVLSSVTRWCMQLPTVMS